MSQQKDRAEFFYNQRSTHVVLGFLSVLLIGLMGYIAYDDWNREWKPYQRQFRALDIERTRRDLAAAEQAGAEQVAQARAALERATAPLEEKTAAAIAQEEKLQALRAKRSALRDRLLAEYAMDDDGVKAFAASLSEGDGDLEAAFDAALGETFDDDDAFYAAFDAFKPLWEEFKALEGKIGSTQRSAKSLVDLAKLDEERAELLPKIEADLVAMKAKATRAKINFQTRKAELDEVKFAYENHKNHFVGPKDAKYQKELARLRGLYAKAESETAALQDVSVAADLAVSNAQAEIGRLNGPAEKARRELTLAMFDQDRLGRKLKSIGPSLVNDAFRNLPLLDFINPSERIQQVIINDVREDLHFTDVRKIDRCQTCHIAIDKAGFEDQPQPLRTHPNLDRYVSDNSPHPMGLMGCTVCHEGNGLATSFDRAAHAPRDLAQEKEWGEKYHWHRLHHWDFPMHKAGNYEASCMKCHQSAEEIPEAQTLLKGKTLFVDNGCYACHAIDKKEFEGQRRPGPGLKHLADKLTPAFAARWIANPWSFRPDSKMPRLFGNENVDTPEMAEKDAALVEAITHYLFSTTEPLEGGKTPPAEPGDATRGRNLVKTIGCMACHTIDDIGADHSSDDSYYQSNFGPNLSKVGTKVNRNWLFNWVLEPKHYWPDTNMPSLRLSEAEANDVAAYLLSLRDDDYLSSPLPAAREEVIDALIVESLIGKMPESDARASVAAQTRSEKLARLGKIGVTFKNCFACHEIKGFEETNPVVVNFTIEGSKDKDQFNFGYIPQLHFSHEQEEAAHHNGVTEPLLSFHHFEHKPEDRFLRPSDRKDDLTGAATLRYPEIYGNKYVPYATDPDNAQLEVEDLFVRKERFEFIFNQVKNPQVWDRGVATPYFSKMKMPQFGLTDDQAHALAVFVNAQVVPTVRGNLLKTSNERVAALAEGRAVLKRFNCYACHTVGVYEDKVTFAVAEGADRYVDGAHPSIDLGRQRVWAASDVYGKQEIWAFDEKADAEMPTGRFAPEPVKAFSKEQWLVGDAWDPAAYDDFTGELGMMVPIARKAASYFVDAVPVFGKGEGWMRQYFENVALAPPVLYREGEKVRPDWLYHWLTNVHTIRPNMVARMPQYDFTVEEATALVRFFAAASDEKWPYGDDVAAEKDADTLAAGEKVFFELLQCNSCHPSGTAMPSGQDTKQWGPNLALAQSRLKMKWLREEWLPNPQGFYPGTYMPNNFYSSEGGGLSPLLGSEEQMRQYIHDVTSWLHSLDPREAITDYNAVSEAMAAGK